MTCREAAEIGRAAGFPRYSAAAHSLSSNPEESGVMRVPALAMALRGEKRSQNELVLEYMQTHGSISQLRATFDLGITRLSGRIYDLKAAGVPIVKETKTRIYPDGTVKRWAEYKIAAPGGGTPETAND